MTFYLMMRRAWQSVMSWLPGRSTVVADVALVIPVLDAANTALADAAPIVAMVSPQAGELLVIVGRVISTAEALAKDLDLLAASLPTVSIEPVDLDKPAG